MSRLSEQIRAAQVFPIARVAMPMRCLDVEAKAQTTHGIVRYRVSCNFGVETASAAIFNDIERKMATERAMRLIIQEVFGEFRPMLIDLYEALYAYNFEAAIEKLSTLEKAMFE